jgi:acetolactate synthase-1/2/3 large subunit
MAAPVRSLYPVNPARGPQTPKVRVADLIVRTLADAGVNTFYGIPGGAISTVYDALLDQPDLRVVNARHETGAVFAAMGHSRVSGEPPCVLMTSGPGVTNAITGLAAAQADGVPLVAIGGEVPRKNFGRGALQEGSRYQLDVLGMVRSVTKFSAEITNPRAAGTLVRKAVATALSGRQGPVFLSLPLDVANEKVPVIKASTNVATQFELDEEMMDGAAEALQDAERGLIIAGSGARHPEAVRWIGTLAATLNIPVITTPKAKGLFPESDPLSLGVFGIGGHPSAAEYLEHGVDTVICVGSGLGETGTNSWSPALQASRTFIQLDIDAAQIGKNYHVDFGLVGPSHVVLRGLVSRLRRRHRNTVETTGIRYYQPEGEPGEKGPLRHDQAVRLLQETFAEDAIYTVDIGEHSIFAIHYLKIDRPESFIINTGLGAMGSGIGAAIGAKLARPDRQVISLCGDYGFQMLGMELATCVHHRIGVVFAVFNDARMRMVESGLMNIFGRAGTMSSHRVDFAALARSVGALGFTIRRPEDFRQLPAELGRTGVPAVLDIEIDPSSSFPANGRVAQIRNFAAK